MAVAVVCAPLVSLNGLRSNCIYITVPTVPYWMGPLPRHLPFPLHEVPADTPTASLAWDSWSSILCWHPAAWGGAERDWNMPASSSAACSPSHFSWTAPPALTGSQVALCEAPLSPTPEAGPAYHWHPIAACPLCPHPPTATNAPWERPTHASTGCSH